MVLAENMVKKATKDAITLCLQENNKARKRSHMTSTMESDDSSVVSMTDSIITEETQSSISGINIKNFTSFNLLILIIVLITINTAMFSCSIILMELPNY